nr:FAD-dependent oxidoreductase [Pseudonocardia sp. EC080619-01]
MAISSNGHVSSHADGAGKLRGYSAWSLFQKGLLGGEWPRVWREHELADSYDVVIVGGGVHGLATAYYLAVNHGITNVAVLEKSYIGSGGSGRNTAILRSNYLTPEGVRFYDRSVKLYEHLAAELNFNVMFSQRGHMTLAHNDSSLRTMRWRAEVNKMQGVDSDVISPDKIKELVPHMDTSPYAGAGLLAAFGGEADPRSADRAARFPPRGGQASGGERLELFG